MNRTKHSNLSLFNKYIFFYTYHILNPSKDCWKKKHRKAPFHNIETTVSIFRCYSNVIVICEDVWQSAKI